MVAKDDEMTTAVQKDYYTHLVAVQEGDVLPFFLKSFNIPNYSVRKVRQI